jgi:hypothetical protein
VLRFARNDAGRESVLGFKCFLDCSKFSEMVRLANTPMASVHSPFSGEAKALGTCEKFTRASILLRSPPLPLDCDRRYYALISLSAGV